MNDLGHILSVFFLSMIPVVEYQFSIPLGISKYHLNPAVTYLAAVLGSLAPLIPLYFGLQPARALLAQIFPRYISILDRHLDRAHAELAKDYDRYGAMALFIALVIPFPFTGIWTMTAAAVMLKIPFKSTMLGIGLGLASGAMAVMLATLGVLKVVWFLK
jgi:uncharacterized membrane protein